MDQSFHSDDLSVLGLVTGYGRRRLGDPRARWVKDNLGGHKKRGEEQVADQRIAKEEEGRREPCFTDRQSLPPTSQVFCIVGGGDPGGGVGNQAKQAGSGERGA